MRARGVVFEQQPRMIAQMPNYEVSITFFSDSEGNLAAPMFKVRQLSLPLLT